MNARADSRRRGLLLLGRRTQHQRAQRSNTGTNKWLPVPWYSTDLATGEWLSVETYQSTFPVLSNGTYLIWFPLTNTASQFYKIVTTNGP